MGVKDRPIYQIRETVQVDFNVSRHLEKELSQDDLESSELFRWIISNWIFLSWHGSCWTHWSIAAGG
ncbi:unnamed protein product [Linum tenue]|uniref:Uncharacterized protein n=1 Tax=Linum tenue TaxID=586396 RepID=A0AAV0KBV2_9ROSI|nr:unnamed protein product [Linum tenue]